MRWVKKNFSVSESDKIINVNSNIAMKNTSENQVNDVYLQCMYHKSEDKLNK